MSIKPPPDPKLHSVLTSDVINQIEGIFKALADKDGLVSQLDIVTLVRSMGMNPTENELTELIDALQIRDPEKEKLERIERDERERKGREQREKEKADAAIQSDKKAAKPPAKGSKLKGKEETKDALLWVPPERRPLVDWKKFIATVEPFYKDNRIEEEEIIQAFRVFDREGKGWIHRDELIKIMCTKGEEVLSPTEVAQLVETFPNSEIRFREFAQRMQGTYVEPKAVVMPDSPEGSVVRPPHRVGSLAESARTLAARTDNDPETTSVAGSMRSIPASSGKSDPHSELR